MGAIQTVSNILPVLSGLASTYTTIERSLDTFRNVGRDPEAERRAELRAQQDLALRQLQQQQQLQQSQIEQSAGLEREKIALQSRQETDARREALRRAVARQRAQFGASGTGSRGGSSEAVLLGLFDETEDDLAKRESLDRLRGAALDLDAAQNRSLNLLQATQLAQKQSLQRLF